MVDSNPKFRQKTPGKHGPSVGIRLVELAVIAIIVYLIFSFIYNTLQVSSVSATTNFTLTNTTTLFSMQGQEYAATLVSASTSTAQVAMVRTPIFLNPTFYVTLYVGNTTNVNVTGKYANMQIKLLDSASGQAMVSITPIPATFDKAPDSSRIRLAQTSLIPFGFQASSLTSATSTNTTNKTTATSTASTTTISQSSTTTISNTVNNYNVALGILKKNSYYSLMANYSAEYAASLNCNPPIYNQSYLSRYGASPKGPDTFLNVSSIVPYNLTLSLTNTSITNWVATYSTESQMQEISGGPALVIKINTTTGYITSTTTEGVFLDINYTRLSCDYSATKSIDNSCGIFVTSSSIFPPSC